jgi:ribonuclease-3
MSATNASTHARSEAAGVAQDLDQRVSALEERLGLQFANRALAAQALLHRSAVLERERESQPALNQPSNERLEFLGDAVANLLLADFAFHHFPDYDEGRLTEIRSALARRSSMAIFAQSIDLGSLVVMSRAEARSGTRGHATVLAEAMEAVLAAVYLDQGFAAAATLMRRMLAECGETLLHRAESANAKSRLQELAQVSLRMVPTYTLIERSGPPHDSRFDVEASVGDLSATGRGTSRQAAEQNAAAALLSRLRGEMDPGPLASPAATSTPEQVDRVCGH